MCNSYNLQKLVIKTRKKSFVSLIPVPCYKKTQVRKMEYVAFFFFLICCFIKEFTLKILIFSKETSKVSFVLSGSSLSWTFKRFLIYLVIENSDLE